MPPTAATNQVTIELRPMTIIEKTDVGNFTAPLGQSQVFCNGAHVGFIGDKPQAPLNFTKQLPAHVRDMISREVSRLRGTAVAQGSGLPDEDTVREMIAQRDREQREQFGFDEPADDDESE